MKIVATLELCYFCDPGFWLEWNSLGIFELDLTVSVLDPTCDRSRNVSFLFYSGRRMPDLPLTAPPESNLRWPFFLRLFGDSYYYSSHSSLALTSIRNGELSLDTKFISCGATRNGSL